MLKQGKIDVFPNYLMKQILFSLIQKVYICLNS